jgi:hypothetical protein
MRMEAPGFQTREEGLSLTAAVTEKQRNKGSIHLRESAAIRVGAPSSA